MIPITCNQNYSINEKGDVFSHKRGRLLTPELMSNGYKRITLCSGEGVNFKATRYLLHRLVAEHFIGNPLNLPHVNHIDNDRSNSEATNLEWCTHAGNMRHCHRQGRCSNIKASNAARGKNRMRMESKFSALLGDNFIKYIPPTTGKRGSVEFICDSCKLIYTARVDSSTFKTNCLCFKCAR
jgi:hypothetical protein